MEFFAALKIEEFVIVSGSVSGYHSLIYYLYYPMLQMHAVESLVKSNESLMFTILFI